MDRSIGWTRLWTRFDRQGSDRDTGPGELHDYDAAGCLFLIGPPGSGKSTEIERAYRALAPSRGTSTFVRLRQVTSRSEFLTLLSDGRRRWVAGFPGWTIFLDGLDELPARNAMLRSDILDVLSTLAAEGKAAFPAQPLRLLVTCRSADLPEDFVRGIEAAWVGEVALLQLEALTEADILLAARNVGLGEGARFAAYINTRGLGPLASSPMTLGMLIRLFEAGEGDLPTSLAQTYRATVSDMLERSRTSAQAANPAFLSQAQLLLGRLAAVCVLSNRQVLWTGVARDAEPADAVAVADVAGGDDGFGDAALPVDEIFVRTVLGSGFFVPDGSNRWVWPHQSFAEFLAADYLAQTSLDRGRLMELLSVREADGIRVVPQLREVAAWLAGIDDVVRRMLVGSEPVLLLRSDVAGADDGFKATLASELLTRLESGELDDFSLDPRVKLAQLSYPRLAELLTPLISNKGRRLQARRVALEIARSCGLRSVGPALLRLATDHDEPISLRASAAVAAGDVTPDGRDLASLSSLLASSHESDPQDELRGAALWVLWPKVLGGEALFAALGPPRDDTLYGWYKAFIYRLDPSTFDPACLRASLAWLNGLDRRAQTLIVFEKLVSAIMRAAWAARTDDRVRAAFADVLVAAADDYGHVLRLFDLSAVRSDYAGSTSATHEQLIADLASRAGQDAGALRRWAIWGPMPLLWPDDLPWLLVQSRHLPGEFLVDAICSVASGKSPEEVAELWQHEAASSDVAVAIKRLFVTDLKGPAAGWAREAHRRAHADVGAGQRPSYRDEQIANSVDACAERPEEWWKLNLLLLADQSGYGNELSGNLAASEGWLQATEILRAKIIRCAYRYLLDHRMQGNDWIGRNTILRTATAGYRALRLLFSEMPSLYEAVPRDAWAHWAPAILCFPSNDPPEERAIQSEIAARAHANAPRDFAGAVEEILDRSNSPHELANLLARCFDVDMGSLVWRAILRREMDPTSARALFRLLVERELPEAVTWTTELFENPARVPEDRNDEDSLEVFAPAILFETSAAKNWNAMWARCQLDPPHALAVWRAFAAFTFFDVGALAALPPAALGDLIEWLKEFHPGERLYASGYLSPDEQLFSLQFRLPGLLATVPSDEAVTILTRIAALHPDDLTLRSSLAAAREARLARAAIWMTPAAILSALGLRSVSAGRGTKHSIEASAAAAAERDGSDAAIDGSYPEPAESVSLEELTHVARGRGPSRSFLFAATEWSSKFGGVSSFNRELASALARGGHRVSCIVPDSNDEQIRLALIAGVTLAKANPITGYTGRDLLDACGKPQVDTPDYVVGHDHVTGRAALRMRDSFFPGATYIHVLHTIPIESEPHKPNLNLPPAMNGLRKDELQREMCAAADLILAVGPRVFERFGSFPGGDGKIHQLVPGLSYDLLRSAKRLGALPLPRVLWIGRTEDRHLKGLPAFMHMASLLQHERLDGVRYPKMVVRGLTPETIGDEINQLSAIAPFETRAVEWHPYTTDQAELLRDYQSSSCFVMPSLFEAFGLVAFEAIAVGLPAIVSSESGVGRFLLEQHRGVRGGIGLPDDAVLDVYDDPARTAGEWCTAIRRRLRDPKAAFEEAALLRERLAGAITWEASTAELVKFLNSTAPRDERDASAPRQP